MKFCPTCKNEYPDDHNYCHIDGVKLIKVSTMRDAFKLADLLHKEFCRLNHTDGCGWGWEHKDGKPYWDGYSHKEWLRKANALIALAHNVTKLTSPDKILLKMIEARKII